MPAREQHETSARSFLQSCTYRDEHVDHHFNFLSTRRQDMEFSLRRLSARKDVEGVLVVSTDGHVLYKCDSLSKWIPTLTPLCSLARDLVREIDPEDALRLFRLRTKRYELIITMHGEQLLIVMQILVSGDGGDAADTAGSIEEDWETFLQRLQQQRLKEEL